MKAMRAPGAKRETSSISGIEATSKDVTPVRDEGFNHPWRRVRFDSVEDVALKPVLEPARRYRYRRRSRECDRTFR
jgi:hypothetical protein